jgi:hypothetical protein
MHHEADTEAEAGWRTRSADIDGAAKDRREAGSQPLHPHDRTPQATPNACDQGSPETGFSSVSTASGSGEPDFPRHVLPPLVARIQHRLALAARLARLAVDSATTPNERRIGSSLCKHIQSAQASLHINLRTAPDALVCPACCGPARSLAGHSNVIVFDGAAEWAAYCGECSTTWTVVLEAVGVRDVHKTLRGKRLQHGARP